MRDYRENLRVMLVSVSLKPDMKQILSSILRQVSKDKCTNAGEKDRDELLRSIRDFLVNKKYIS